LRIAAAHDAEQVDLQHFAPFVHRGVDHRPAAGDAGVVHEHVEHAELRIDRLVHHLELGVAADVHRNREVSFAVQQRDGFACALEHDVHARNRAARLRVTLRERAAETTAGAGDQDLAGCSHRRASPANEVVRAYQPVREPIA